MKKLNLVAACIAMFLVQWTSAQQKAAAPIDRPAEPNLLFDDDGGKVQFVPADLSASAGKTFHGGAVMKSLQQISIFLGSGWADDAVRSRQNTLADVGNSSSTNPHFAEAKAHKVKVLRAAPQAEDFTDLSTKPLNDLDIQRKLNDMLQSKAIPAPDASTVYVVFLGPKASSSLGGNQAGVDYAAYHNVVNLDAGEVRYVVVPFQKNAERQAEAAIRALVETGLNPNGQGWF
jgi:hypothetical protein